MFISRPVPAVTLRAAAKFVPIAPHEWRRRADGAHVSDAVARLESRSEVDRALLAVEDRAAWELSADHEVQRLEDAALALGDMELVWRARLLSAELECQAGNPAEGVRMLRKVSDYAAANGHVRLESRSHLILAWTYREVGDPASSLEHAVKAVELLDTQPPSPIRALYLIRLADALDECGATVEARVRYQQAEAIAMREGNIPLLLTCLNNRAYGEYIAGDLDEAQTTTDRLVELSRLHDEPLRPHLLDTIARIHMAAGRYAEAIVTARKAIDDYRGRGTREAISLPEFLLTLVAAQRQLGVLDAAQTDLDECRAIGAAAGLASVLARVDEEQSELHAARGDFEKAFHGLKAFHTKSKELLSEQRAIQSRMRQEMLETNEVRAEATRLRGEAHRDPLTGLYNRRYVDETLSKLLTGRAPDTVLAAAMVDLDHFKRVNDMFSHSAGDEVLVAIARLLTDVASEGLESEAGCFAARLGGEEFLVVLTGLTREHAADRIERLRTSVANSDWTNVIGDLRMTLSAGIAWANGEDSQYSLLHRADNLLFDAKNAGRNRLCFEDA